MTTAAGTYTAGRLVICPGAWAPELLADLGVPLTVERQVMYWFQPRRRGRAVHRRTGSRSGSTATAASQLYGFPAIDGPDGGVKVAFFRRGEVCTPETIDREVHPEEVEFIADAPARAAADDARPADCRGHLHVHDDAGPALRHRAAIPRHEQVTVACGFSGHGFKFVPVVGEILADLALTGTTAHPIGLFDPRRPMTPAAAGGPTGHGS